MLSKSTRTGTSRCLAYWRLRWQTPLASLSAQSSALEKLIRAGNEQTSQISSRLEIMQENSQIVQLRKSLQFENTRPKAVKAYSNTFNWVYSATRDEYKGWENWLISDGRIFCIQGKAGSGKSTLMNYLASNPRTKQIFPNCAVYSYFIWRSSGDAFPRCRKGIFCSLLYQMLESDYYASKAIEKDKTLVKKMRNSDWNLEELERTFLVLLVFTPNQCVSSLTD